MYGVDLYTAQDGKDTPLQLGVCSNGLYVFQPAYVKRLVYAWPTIMKISFKRKQFYIQVKMDNVGVRVSKFAPRE